MYYQNVRGLRTKLDTLCNSLLSSSVSYDVIIFVETWLNSAISNVELGLSNYAVFRCDRSSATSRNMRGGGVLIAVKKSIPACPINVSCPDIEQLFVRVRLHVNKYLTLGATYIPPASQSTIYASHVDTIMEVFHKFSEDSFALFGDYNLPHAVWYNDSGLACFRKPGISTNESNAIDLLLGCAGYCNLSQVNTVFNDSDVMLDLIFATGASVTSDRVIDALILPDAYHPPLYMLYNDLAITDVSASENVVFKDFKRGDYQGMLAYFNSVDWDVETGNVDPCVALERLYYHINCAINAFIPVRTVVHSTFPYWFSPRLRVLIGQKKRAHKAFKRSSAHSDYLNFSHLRSQCKSVLLRDHRSYIDDVESAVIDNVSSFWKFVNTKRGGHTIPGQVHLDQLSASTQGSAADLFAKFFGSVYVSPSAVVPAVNPALSSGSNINIHALSVPIGDIYSRLESLDMDKGPGLDGLPPLLFRKCSFILARPLWHIFNSSLSKGIFPTAWKSSIVTPVFKAGDHTDVRNYRPICKLSVLPKLFEELVTEYLTPCLTNVICDEQHGFVPGRSTVTNLAVYHCLVSAALDNRSQVDTVYTDFRKAFDTVDHSILLRKLEVIGICGPLLSWIHSYLKDRVQVVRVGNQLSTPVNVCSGVPQGSHLGPLLFILFINDLKDVFRNSNFLMYADDLKIFRSIRCDLDVDELQDDLCRFELWCTANMMQLNTAKCVVMRSHRTVNPILSNYTLCGTPLIEVGEIRDLGVIFVSGLDFRNHYRNIACKAMKTLGFIARFAKHFKRVKSLKLLYVALVRPQIEYASVIWSPRHIVYSSLLERVQHKFCRLVMRATGSPMRFFDHDYAPALLKLGLTTLSARRICSDLLFLYKLIRGQTNCQELVSLINFHAPQRSLRLRPLFEARVPDYRHCTADPVNRAMEEVNSYIADIDLFSITLDSFRRQLSTRVQT